MTVIFLLLSEMLITLEGLSVRSAIALPSHFKIHVGTDCYFIRSFWGFLTCFPRK